MKILTAQQLRTLDSRSGDTLALMEAAGARVVAAIEERFEISLPKARTSTAAGLLAELAGRIPQPGERFLIRGLEFDVLQASPTRVERVIIRRGPPSPVVLAPTLDSGSGS